MDVSKKKQQSLNKSPNGLKINSGGVKMEFKFSRKLGGCIAKHLGVFFNGKFQRIAFIFQKFQ